MRTGTSTPDYGYIFSTVDDQGYNLSPADTLGPVAIPAIDPTVRPTWQPTGLTIAAGAKHRDVQISWDEPPDGSNVTASPSTGNGRANQIRPTYASTGPPRPASSSPATGTRTSPPTTTPATRTSTSTRCTHSTPPSHRTVSSRGLRRLPARRYAAAGLSNRHTHAQHRHLRELGRGPRIPEPASPTGLTLETRFRGRPSDNSTIIARWEDVENAPGYKVRWRETSETDWREQGRSRSSRQTPTPAATEPSCPHSMTDESGASGRTASSSPPASRPGPGCSTQAPTS